VTVSTGLENKETVFVFGPEGSASAPWLSLGSAYVFRIYSLAPKRRLLARLRVDHQTSSLEVVSLSQAPNVTSPAENRMLQLIPFGAALFFALLTATYVREVRHSA
jgi:hypothetical protein